MGWASTKPMYYDNLDEIFLLPHSCNPSLALFLHHSRVSHLLRSHDNHLVSRNACPNGKNMKRSI